MSGNDYDGVSPDATHSKCTRCENRDPLVAPRGWCYLCLSKDNVSSLIRWHREIEDDLVGMWQDMVSEDEWYYERQVLRPDE